MTAWKTRTPRRVMACAREAREARAVTTVLGGPLQRRGQRAAQRAGQRAAQRAAQESRMPQESMMPRAKASAMRAARARTTALKSLGK